MKIRALLVDDHAFLRSGLRLTLSEIPDLEVVGEAATGNLALKLMAEIKPDLIFMDIHLPDLNGIEVGRRILKEHDQAKIIIFSGDHTRELIDEALEAGICGYLSKACLPDQLAQAVEAVLMGKLYLSPELSSDILTNYKTHLTRTLCMTASKLSELDRQMMRFIAEGLANKEISEKLNMTPKAVEAYRARLLKRLGLSKSAELIRFALREGIAKP